MTNNQSTRNVQLFIGGKDFTPCLISFQGSDNHLDQSGLVSFTGQIVLGNAIDFDESIDDRKNPTRFCRGRSVILNIANSSGTLLRHPRGALRMLTPKYDLEKQQLTLEVGDLIALLNFKEPTDPDKANNKDEECQGKPASQVIFTLLAAAGITNISGSLPSTVYNYPLNLSGSYLQSVGKILYANNLFGWVDKNEQFRIQQANIAIGAGGLSLLVGRDEISYRRLDGAESPNEIIKAVGTQMIVRPTPAFLEDTSEEYGTASTVNKNYGDTTIVIRKTKRGQEWNKGEHKLKIKTETIEPFGLVIPEAFWNKTSDGFVLSPLLTSITSEIIIEESHFEDKQECKLKTKETRTYQPRATYLAEFKEAQKNYYFGDIAGLNLVKSVVETYEYDAKDRLKKITTKVSELEISILNGTDENWSEWIFPPEYLVPSETTIQEWRELNKDSWEYRAFSYKCLVRINPELVKYQAGSKIISNKTNLIADSKVSVRRVSNSGQEVPPAPERCPPCCTFEESNIEEKATFADPCSGSFKQRERTFNVEFLAGKSETVLKPGEVRVYSITGGSSAAHSQLQAIAKREGRLLWGRWKGQELAMAMVDGVFNHSPLMTVRATEPDGIVQLYLADGCSWVVSQQKALWSCDGIWVGTSIGSGDNETVLLPYSEPQTLYLGMGIGCDFTGYPYALTTTTAHLQLGEGEGLRWNGGFLLFSAGIGQGADFTGGILDLYWEDFEWDETDEISWNNLDSSPAWNATEDWENVNWDNLL
ncbi:hypothetical protein ACE1AT_11150 [Pelatocladus sp. BLCC-F211]|uniref:hypothetical protein n=1 Tax=Pelatocladus sp. BLCC-F211 TaxID=3342752 RepID=UPI0035B861B4